jgi:hypothetical protein
VALYRTLLARGLEQIPIASHDVNLRAGRDRPSILLCDRRRRGDFRLPPVFKERRQGFGIWYLEIALHGSDPVMPPFYVKILAPL